MRLMGQTFAANQLVIFSGELKVDIVLVRFFIQPMIPPDFKGIWFGNVSCVPWMALNFIGRAPGQIDSTTVGFCDPGLCGVAKRSSA